MRYASDYRKIARTALRGRWLRTALILLLATLLGASMGIGTVDLEGNLDYNPSLQNVGISLESYRTILYILLAVTLVLSLLSIFVGSLVRVGTYRVGAAVLEGEKPRVGMLFPKGIYWKAVGVNLLTSLLVSLWTLLLIVPGIIASYRYAMAEYLLMKNPALSPMEAVNQSKALMRGNKMRMFSLELSFIGWSLLCSLPASAGLYAALLTRLSLAPSIVLAGVGGLLSFVGGMFLSAYMQVAICAFFDDLHNAAWREADASYAHDAWNADETDASARTDGEGQQPNHFEDREPRAREIFFDNACSRVRIAQAGLLEEYAACGMDASVEHRWLREYGQALMLRFDRDAQALDALLDLIGEYALDDLADRVLQRIDRHIRQRSLPAREVLGMLGRSLAVLTSGVFDDREAYLRRKQEQCAEMAARLMDILEAEDPEGNWRGEMGMVLMLCNGTEA